MINTTFNVPPRTKIESVDIERDLMSGCGHDTLP